MKKFVLTFATLWMICLAGIAQDAADLFRELRKESNAEYVNVNPFLMFVGKLFASDMEDKEMISKIRSAKVLDLENCSSEKRQRFVRSVESLYKKNYELLIKNNDDGERTYILAKIKKDIIRELLIANIDGYECSLVLLKGKIHKQDIHQLADK